MNLTVVKTGLRRAIGKAGMALSKAKPEIFLGIGLIGTGVATVMACKASTNLSTELAQIKEDFQLAKDVKASVKAVEEGRDDVTIIRHQETGQPYTKKDSKRCTITAIKLAFIRMVKLYGPAALVYAASVVSILYGFSVLKSRYTAVLAVAAGLGKTLQEYRARVKELIGDEQEELLYSGAEIEEVAKATTNEKGEAVVETAKKKVVTEAKRQKHNPYQYLFDECNVTRGFDAKGFTNYQHIVSIQQWANRELKQVGWLYLWKVLDALGYDREIVKEAAASGDGWVYVPGDNGYENMVDFGLMDYIKSVGRENDPSGRLSGERSFLLTFNCDGFVSLILKDEVNKEKNVRRAAKLARIAERREARRARDVAGRTIVDTAINVA